MPRSTEEVVTEHAATMASVDLHAIAADYSANAAFVVPGHSGNGPDGIRRVYAHVLEDLAGLTFRRTSVHIDGALLYSTWTASDSRRNLVGSDTFVVVDGLIDAHTAFYAEIGGP